MAAPPRCAMRDTCGRKGIFGAELPCPYTGPPVEPDTDKFRTTLVSVCGPDFAQGPVCCTQAQVEALHENLGMASSMISSCPACHNNFRDFFCSFTCSPNQGNFVNVTATRTTSSGQEAVAAVDHYVSNQFRNGFYDSCKGIQFAATNGFAMDLIGGGAKNGTAFLEFLGEEKQPGSPFPIRFPAEPFGDLVPFDATPRLCSSEDLSSRCSCLDCSDVCPSLPPPPSTSQCHVGAISCLSFLLILAYGLAAGAFVFGFVLQRTIRRKRERAYERVALSADTGSTNNIASPASQHRHLLGASSLAYNSTDDSQEGLDRTVARGASLLDPMDAVQPRQHKLNTLLRRGFYRLGLYCASHPWLIFALVFTVIGLLNLGWKQFDVERDPVRLWVSPTSESRIQKETFDKEFGPFYRAEQIFVTVEGGVDAEGSSAVLNFERLEWLAGVQEEIRGLRSTPNNYTLSDVCFKPGGPRGACVVQSVIAWFSDGDIDEDYWDSHIESCAARPAECLPDFMQPLSPQYVLGGAPYVDGDPDDRDWLKSKAMVINYVVSNSLDPEEVARAEEWERELRAYLTTVSTTSPAQVGAHVTFQTGVSLEEELNKSTNTDIPIVVMSYLVMFFYVALTLGDGSSAGPEDDGFFQSFSTWAKNLPRLVTNRQSIALTDDPDLEPATWLPRFPRRLFVGSKFTLGLFGISLVILSVAAAAGFFSLLGVKSTLIIAEVIPFLVLAVGVDNIFILVHEVDRQGHLHGPYAALGQANNGSFTGNPMSPNVTRYDAHDSDADSAPRQLPAEERIARAMAKMGPSILLSSLTETLAFALGALVPMPAVRNFALYAAGSVFINAVLQITVFVSALALDVRRTEAGRIDCFPCIRMPSKIVLLDISPTVHASRLARIIRRHYAPFLLRESVKLVVLIAFGALFVASVISIQHIELGLDERLALPRDSYLIEYFNDLHQYLEIGPPTYFVVQQADETSRTGQRELCGRFTTCEQFSLPNILEVERRRSESSYIATPTASWIDDFFLWLNPALDKCCRVRKANPSQFCTTRDSDRLCQPCLEDQTPAWNITMEGLPQGAEFMRYVKQWLNSPTTEECPVAGQASYGTAVRLDGDVGIEATHFRTFHTPLRTQADFIGAFSAAHRIAEDISHRTGLDVFPYSSFYVFFDQYAHIIGITQEVLGLGLASVLIVTSVLLGSWRTGTIVTGVVALTVVNVMGVMGLWGINLNAVSVVNLVISLGIAVEFCSHVARAFMGAGVGLPVDHPSGQRERDERMWIALVDVGPSVLSGITFTKLIGMSVMAFTKSQLLEIYHFRMWVTLIVSGALHGLVLLPVVLSLAGGPGYTLEDADEEWMANAIRRSNRDHDYEYRPFLQADTDSIVSE
ncbi:multidrug efflux transporter AcrB transmembrane domain-containing protein [Auricularia subglabra TFB-10046 SS5]|nr:multidrug efflux transporter AcrB transmembrane domain-containing protein [Auricularia subglabra TFB-10046 SS5]